MSDDGAFAIVVIALLGNPFSPAFARARADGRARPLDHAALNVAVYGRRASAWALSERAVRDEDRSAAAVVVGRSVVRWDPSALVVDVDEERAPFGGRIRGRVIVRPEVVTSRTVALDPRGAHLWWPIAPCARVEVDLPSPGVRFAGHGYFDANAGDAPLEEEFERWSWSRARVGPRAVVTYDLVPARGAPASLGFHVGRDGACEPLGDSRRLLLPRTQWGLTREARCEGEGEARLVRALEDGPFYARSLVATRLGGAPVVAMHEALDAARLRRRWVRFLSRFRMRREAL